MSLLNDQLSLWEIAYRWANLTPSSRFARIPLAVQDNFRLMMDAILKGNLVCETLSLEKRRPDSESPPEFFIRHFIDDVYYCIAGLKYNRKLLRHAEIERWAMQQWCERQGIPLPEFWFPPGWKIHYEWQDPDADEPLESTTPAETTGVEHTLTSPELHTLSAKPSADSASPNASPMTEDEAEGRRRLDRRQRSKIACQEVAVRVWGKNTSENVKTIANSPEVQDLAGGSEYDFAVVLRWIAEVDPRDPSKRRGPKRKK